MAGRTVLIRMMRDKEVANFKEMVDARIITPALYGAAEQIRLWADVVGHEDIGIDALDEDEVRDLLDYLGTVLEAVYTHQARVDRFVEKRHKIEKDGAGTPAAPTEVPRQGPPRGAGPG